MLRSRLLFILILGVHTFLFSQHQELSEKPGIWKGENASKVDSTSLVSAFKRGTVQGHFRYFLSSVNNASPLTDYYANAMGGGLRFETATFHHFRFAVSGFYIFNAGSSDLAFKDPSSGLSDRYEIGLFDITDNKNTKEISRIEELYIKYQIRQTKVTLGRQLINTPFINLQDGRMRPTSVEGIVLETGLNRLGNLQLAWLYGIAPRSTRKYYRIEDSFGLYPSGVAEDGKKSDYFGNIKTAGIALLSWKSDIMKNLNVELHDVWVENVLNSAMIQLNYQVNKNGNNKYVFSSQLIRQQISGEGGNADPSKSYVSKSWSSLTYGFKAGWTNEKWDWSINYNRITSEGRYMLPREWGRDPFFTFMPRERNEGLGGVHAIVLKSGYAYNKDFSTNFSFGYFSLPDVKNYFLNKYGMPSYTQLNADIRYRFSGFLKGFETQFLYVYKWNQGNTYGDPKFIIHKVNMSLVNFIVNFRF